MKADFERAIELLAPDILTLNEYVHGPTREAMVAALADMGLAQVLVTKRVEGHNQVLIASRTKLVAGDLAAPQVSVADSPNFLHVHLPAEDFELVAMRVPWYEKAKEKGDYWEQFHRLGMDAIGRKILFIGDLNVDPGSKCAGTRWLNRMVDDGWHLPSPEGPWSYISRTGMNSRIDHALASPHLRIAGARYVSEIGGVKLAGPDASAISDHAALVVDLAV